MGFWFTNNDQTHRSSLVPYKRQTLFLERIAYIDRLPWLVVPRERGRLARILIPANSLPSTATPSQSAPNPPLRGSLRTRLCAGWARAPGGGTFDRLHCLHRAEKVVMPTDRESLYQFGYGSWGFWFTIRRIAHPWFHTGFWNESPTLTAYLGVGERAASRVLIPANRPLPRKARQTRLYGLFHCAKRRPRSRVVFCRPHPNRCSRSRSWRSLGASRSLADRRGCRMGHSMPISGSSQRMAIWSSAS